MEQILVLMRTTVPSNLIMGLAYLSSQHGQEIQECAYTEIIKTYPNGDAWDRCVHEEKIEYISAVVKEILRYFTVIPICLPRVSVKDIRYKDVLISAGSTFFMVRRRIRQSIMRLIIG